MRRPTTHGQTLGDLRILVLGSKGDGKSFFSGLLLEDNEDVIEIGQWEEAEYGRVLRASTDWVEHQDGDGLENFEPTRNVEIVELPGYDRSTDVSLGRHSFYMFKLMSCVRSTTFYEPYSLLFKYPFTLYPTSWIPHIDLPPL
jgi:hypothetical protein